jgi:hypothetical protein
MINTGELPYVKNATLRREVLHRVLRGFQESCSDFLDAILVFSAAMHFASITRYAQLFSDPDETVSAYGLTGSIFMSAFTIFPSSYRQSQIVYANIG